MGYVKPDRPISAVENRSPPPVQDPITVTVPANVFTSGLTFRGYEGFGIYFLDDITVEDLRPTSVPEPATLTLTALGLVATVKRARRTRNNC